MTKKLFGKILAIGLLAATQASFAQEVKTQVEPIAVEGLMPAYEKSIQTYSFGIDIYL